MMAFGAAGIAFVLQRDPSIDWSSFQTRLRQTLTREGFITLEETSCDMDQVTLPLSMRWDPRGWFGITSGNVVTGFPNSADRFMVSLNGRSVDCYVRYVEGRASVIDVRSDSANQGVAAILHSKLTEGFPRLPIRMQTYQ